MAVADRMKSKGKAKRRAVRKGGGGGRGASEQAPRLAIPLPMTLVAPAAAALSKAPRAASLLGAASWRDASRRRLGTACSLRAAWRSGAA